MQDTKTSGIVPSTEPTVECHCIPFNKYYHTIGAINGICGGDPVLHKKLPLFRLNLDFSEFRELCIYHVINDDFYHKLTLDRLLETAFGLVQKDVVQVAD